MALVKQGKIMLLHPLTRGIVAYSVLWPTGSIIQQTLAGEKWGKFKHTVAEERIVERLRTNLIEQRLRNLANINIQPSFIPSICSCRL